jgi:hypothetical protein
MVGAEAVAWWVWVFCSQVSPTLTAEELTNQVLEMRGTAAGMDLWLTFEILEHGELGEYDHLFMCACVCMCTCVCVFVWSTSMTCVTKYNGHPTHLCETPPPPFFFFGTGVWTQDLHLEPLHQPFFVMGFFKTGLVNYLPWLASNCDTPDLLPPE